jgi:hypothetical protein
MTGGRVRGIQPLSAIALPALILALAGCGDGRAGRPPSLSELPLVPGAQVVVQATQCDRGANGFCALEAVIVDPRYKTSEQLVDAEHEVVHRAGWAGVGADTGDERAAESPGHKLRVTYATAYGDLKGIDLGWIHRSPKIAYALSRALFDHASAMSVEVDLGSS